MPAYVFTAYTSVRVILGVSAKELPDAVLADDVLSNKLYLDLISVDPDILSAYEAAKALDTVPATTLVAAMDIFAAQAMAVFCLAGLPMFAPKSVTDGKGGFSRDAGAPYVSVSSRVSSEYDQYRKALVSALSVYNGTGAVTVAAPVLYGSSTPTSDPVTGA